MEQNLEYTDEGLLNLDIFFENDVNFYIEDKEQEYRYETIFNELFDMKIEKIFPLGGKENVKKKYLEMKNADKLGKNFFIVDADFDIVLNKNIIKDKHFIYLQKYEIENYLIDENAIIEFLKDELCCVRTSAEDYFKLSEWKDTIIDDLYELFLLYLLVQHLDLEKENTGQVPNQYFDKKGRVSKDKINNYYNEIKEILPAKYDIQKEIKKLDILVKKTYNNELSDFIKGKFLLTGLRIYLYDVIHSRKRNKSNFNSDVFMNYLYRLFDKTSLNYIKEHVLRYI